ncbi:MAG: putative lipid II flippase FtsW [Eubacteriales bacterium]|nr:putative lipid II flippase FtsW [Eubacteriales bacterium]
MVDISAEKNEKSKSSRRKSADFWIMVIVITLTATGIIMVFSASYAFAYNSFGDVFYYLKNQLKFALTGTLVMLAAMNFDYRHYAKLSLPLAVFSIILLFLVKIPGIGHEENGAMRWIYLGPVNFQPSEIAKISVIMLLSLSLSKNRKNLGKFLSGFMPYLAIIAFYAVLLIWEPHMSAAIILILVSFILLFIAGARLAHFAVIALPGIAAVTAVILKVDYMRTRVLSFLDPFKDPLGEGYQVVQSLYAIGSGGLLGKGLGKSLQKFMYLPYPHNDFIFSIIVEELGLVGAFIILLLFAVLIWRGVRVALSAPDSFGRLLAFGLTCLIGIQVILNIAVVTSSMPPTGVSLPFLSAGGSSLVVLMGSTGILLNISKHTGREA